MAESLIVAYLLDGKGAGRKLTFDEVKSWQPDDGMLWAHFDYSQQDSQQWIVQHSGLPDVCTSALIREETRPRTLAVGDGLLLALRGVNLNPSADPEDMVSIRMYVDEHRIISSRNRRLLTTDDIIAAIESGRGPKNSADFLCAIIAGLTHRIENIVDRLEERADELEAFMLGDSQQVTRSDLAALRGECIAIRRYLSPQREAMSSLLVQRVSWLNELSRLDLREVGDHLLRIIENLDATKDRASVIHEELVSQMSEQLNRRMYVLSIVSVVFMPLGFLTGLLGVNIAGIPGAEYPHAFVMFCVGLLLLTAIQVVVFKRFKWM